MPPSVRKFSQAQKVTAAEWVLPSIHPHFALEQSHVVVQASSPAAGLGANIHRGVISA